MFRVSRRFATSATTTTTARGAVAGGGNIATTTTTGKPVTTKTARILVPKTTGEGRVSAAQLKAVRASLQQHGTLTGAPSPLPEPPALAPGALKAAQHQQHLIASGISAHGTGARLLVLQRGARPRGQNALTASHLRRLDALIQRFATDTLAHSIVIQSDQPTCFSVGADARVLLAAARGPESAAWKAVRSVAPHDTQSFEGDCTLSAFLDAGTRLAHTLSSIGTPVVTLGGGVCAGAGGALFLGGALRCVNRDSRLSFPDVALGLAPSAGASVWLSRLTSAPLGLYAAVTGAPLGAADMLAGGVATHWCDDVSFRVGTADSIGAELATLYSRDLERLVLALELHAIDSPAPPPLLTRHGAVLERVFAEPTAARVVAALRAVDESQSREWALRTAALMETHCPLAVSATLRLVREARHMPLADALVLEHRVTRRLAARGATVLDALEARLEHGKAPAWPAPVTLGSVREADVDELFAAPANKSAEREHERSLVAYRQVDHLPKASQTLAVDPLLPTEPPRAALLQLLEERAKEADAEVALLEKYGEDALNDPSIDLQPNWAVRESLLQRDELLPVDRI